MIFVISGNTNEAGIDTTDTDPTNVTVVQPPRTKATARRLPLQGIIYTHVIITARRLLQ